MSDANRKTRIRWILGLSFLVVGYLIANRNNPQHPRRDIANQALTVAVAGRDIAGVRSALRQGANPNIDDINNFLPYVHDIRRSTPMPETLLLYAITHSPIPATDTTIARLLLEAGENPNSAWKDGYTPLMAAAMRGDVNYVRLLLANGAEANARDSSGKTALDWLQMPANAGDVPKSVIVQNKNEVAELLKQAGAKE